MGNETCTESRMSQQMNKLDATTASLQEVVEQTVSRLSPVLRSAEPRPNQGDAAGGLGTAYSSLAQHLEDQAGKVSSATEVLRNVLTRLDI